jgi:nicotinamide mononucleotide transporter
VTEILGFVTGVVNVWLLAQQRVWNWPVGLANNLLYAVVFTRSGLYGDAGLQLVYIALGVYGWWLWTTGAPASSAGRVVTRTPRAVWVWLAAATVVAALVLRLFLVRYTDSTVPGWDAVTTAISLAAIYGQAKKYLESWILWIAVDLVYIPLYLYKDLALTALLYAIFLVLCVGGWRSWRRSLLMAPAGSPSPLPSLS